MRAKLIGFQIPLFIKYKKQLQKEDTLCVKIEMCTHNFDSL